MESKITALNDKKMDLKKRKDKLSRVSNLLLAFSIFSAIGGTIMLFLTKDTSRTIIAVAIPFYAAIPLFLSLNYLQQIRRFEDDLKEVEFDIDIQTFEIDNEISYAEKTLRLHNTQLSKYYDLNLRQNTWVFGLGIFCIILGFLIILFTIYLVYLKKDDFNTQVITAVLGGISAILSNFIAALYLKMNSNASDNLKEFHGKLIETHKLLMSNLIVSKIKDTQTKETTYSEVAKGIVSK